VSWLHVRAPPGCPRSVGNLKALRCFPPLPRRWPLYFRPGTPGPLTDIERVKSCQSSGIAHVSKVLVLGVALSEAQGGGVALRKYKGRRRRRTGNSEALQGSRPTEGSPEGRGHGARQPPRPVPGLAPNPLREARRAAAMKQRRPPSCAGSGATVSPQSALSRGPWIGPGTSKNQPQKLVCFSVFTRLTQVGSIPIMHSLEFGPV
jgi:hypothetical protein